MTCKTKIRNDHTPDEMKVNKSNIRTFFSNTCNVLSIHDTFWSPSSHCICLPRISFLCFVASTSRDVLWRQVSLINTLSSTQQTHPPAMIRWIGVTLDGPFHHGHPGHLPVNLAATVSWWLATTEYYPAHQRRPISPALVGDTVTLYSRRLSVPIDHIMAYSTVVHYSTHMWDSPIWTPCCDHPAGVFVT